MRKNLMALGITLGSILYAAIWTRIFYFNFNYREIGEADDLFVYSVMFICFYNFGVYISAAIFQLLSKRERDIVPSALVYGSISGWILGFSIIFLPIFIILCTLFIDGIIYLFYIVWIIFLLPQLVIIQAVCKFENNKYISSKRVFLKIATALLINLILLLVVCHNDFPGVNAPIEIRQKWAYKELSHYPETANFVKNAEKITEKVGEVKFVAPTQGRNLITNSTGSGGGGLSLQDSLYTLEVVGEKATGIAYIRGWRANFMYESLCFEYQGKKTQILSGQDSKCGNQ